MTLFADLRDEIKNSLLALDIDTTIERINSFINNQGETTVRELQASKKGEFRVGSELYSLANVSEE